MSNCVYCNLYPKNGQFDGCCRTCSMSRGRGGHGEGCTKKLGKPLCIFCSQYPKNGQFDGCCRTCSMSKGDGRHGQGCTKNLVQQLCVYCKKYPRNGQFDGCCRSCYRLGGHGDHDKDCTNMNICTHMNICTSSEINNNLEIDNVIKFYDSNQSYYQFTNFYPAPITMTVNGQTFVFPTSEHYYQAMKYANDSNWQSHILTIISNPLPRSAFEYTRKNVFDQSFHSKKDKVMYDAVFAKFTQHPNLAKILKSTKTYTLIEDSPFDSYWGIGNGTGQNKLGKILMAVRSAI